MQQSPVPAPPPPWAPPGAAAPARAPAAAPVPGQYAGEPLPPTTWTPVRWTPPAPTRRGGALRPLLAVACAIVAALAGFGMYRTLFADRVPAALRGYIDGRGVDYTTADGTVRLRLPAEPTVEEYGLTVQGTSVHGRSALVRGKNYEVAVFEFTGVPLTGSEAQIRSALGGAAGGAFAGGSITHKGTDQATLQGYPAVVAHGTKDGSRIEVTFFATSYGIYGLAAHTDHGTATVLREMQNSLIVLEG